MKNKTGRYNKNTNKNNKSANSKNEKTKKWFKAKTYGYGWHPATWEGWLALIIFMTLILSVSMGFEYFFNSDKRLAPYFAMAIFALSGLLIFISYKKGEKAGWRWGNKGK